MKIALVEDEAKLATTLKEGLQGEGYEVDIFPDGESFEKGYASASSLYMLLILDLMLPGKSGFDVCKDLRNAGSTMPVLILTARDSIEDKVSALDSGADDFLTKPFVFEELMARMRAITRRMHGSVPEKIEVQDISIDLYARRASRKGSELPLTPTEFDLLCLLAIRGGTPVSREEIGMHLWNIKDAKFSNVVDVHMSNLRKKIGDEHDQKIIRTIRGAGYAIQK